MIVEPLVVKISEPEPIIVKTYEQGPPGPPGQSVGINLLAGEIINGHMPIYVSGSKALRIPSLDPIYANKCIGLSKTSANLDESFTVVSSGVLTGLSGLFTDMPVYISTSGGLTQTLPIVGFIQEVGVATSSSSILVSIKQAIVLE
jgi:hypothetical protein